MPKALSPLTKYIYYIQNKTDTLDESAKQVNIMSILNISEDDPLSSIYMDQLLNSNPILARNVSIDKVAEFHKSINRSKHLQYMSDKSKKIEDVILELKQQYPDLSIDDIKTYLQLVENNVQPAEDIICDIDNISPIRDAISANLITQCALCKPDNHDIQRTIFDFTTKDISRVKVLFVGEAPAVNEIKEGKPFVGRAGQLLRQTLSNIGFDNIDWGVMNVCLCFHEPSNPPTKTEIANCFDNLELVISNLPIDAVIVPLGNYPCSRFGITDKITDAMSKIYKYNGHLVLPCIHPSAICRNMSRYDIFANRLKQIRQILDSHDDVKICADYNGADIKQQFMPTVDKSTNTIKVSNDKPSSKETESPDYEAMLVNTIYDYQTSKVIYVLRHGQHKIYYPVDDKYTLYYGKSSNVIEYKNKLKSKTISFKDRVDVINNLRNSGYDVFGDMNLSVYKNIQFRNENTETEQPLRIAIIDIELFLNGNMMLLDNMNEAAKRYTISLVTLYDNFTDTYYTFINNSFKLNINKEDIIQHLDYKDECNIEILEYPDERKMLRAFITKFDELDPDLVSGWNSNGFDWPLIIYRCQHLGIECKNRYGKIYINDRTKRPVIPCVVECDYLTLYKKRTFSKRESYSLNFITEHELGIKKLTLDKRFDDMWLSDPNRFIAYNINDVHLVRKLDNKLKYIDVQFNIIRATNISWEESFNTLPIIDGLLFTTLDKEGRTAIAKKYGNERENDESTEKLKGAFVRKPLKGLYDWLADLDLSSLYPYIIARYNISIDTYVGRVDEYIAREYIYNREDLLSQPDRLINYEDKQLNVKQITVQKLHDTITKHNLIITIAGTMYLNHDTKLSVYYEIIDMLIRERKKYKDEMFKAIESNNTILADRYNNWQFTYKVLTNSLYGGIANQYFRLFHFPSAETITATGREIVTMGAYHIHQYLNKMRDNHKIDVEPYEFDTRFLDAETLDNIVYGDSVDENTKINVGDYKKPITIKDIFDMYSDHKIVDIHNREYIFIDNNILTYEDGNVVYKPINNISRHKVNKALYKITTQSGKELIVTEDHSIMVERDGKLIQVKPNEILNTDLVLTNQK